MGGLIGLERERAHVIKRTVGPGFRTHILVTVASCLIQLVSVYGYRHVSDPSRYDPTRVASQAVSGIGFLGAGAIIRTGADVVKGLTSAATLWMCMALGLACGVGYFIPAGICTLIVIFTLIIFKMMEERCLRKQWEPGPHYKDDISQLLWDALSTKSEGHEEESPSDLGETTPGSSPHRSASIAGTRGATGAAGLFQAPGPKHIFMPTSTTGKLTQVLEENDHEREHGGLQAATKDEQSGFPTTDAAVVVPPQPSPQRLVKRGRRKAKSTLRSAKSCQTLGPSSEEGSPLLSTLDRSTPNLHRHPSPLSTSSSRENLYRAHCQRRIKRLYGETLVAKRTGRRASRTPISTPRSAMAGECTESPSTSETSILSKATSPGTRDQVRPERESSVPLVAQESGEQEHDRTSHSNGHPRHRQNKLNDLLLMATRPISAGPWADPEISCDRRSRSRSPIHSPSQSGKPHDVAIDLDTPTALEEGQLGELTPSLITGSAVPPTVSNLTPTIIGPAPEPEPRSPSFVFPSPAPSSQASPKLRPRGASHPVRPSDAGAHSSLTHPKLARRPSTEASRFLQSKGIAIAVVDVVMDHSSVAETVGDALDRLFGVYVIRLTMHREKDGMISATYICAVRGEEEAPAAVPTPVQQNVLFSEVPRTLLEVRGVYACEARFVSPGEAPSLLAPSGSVQLNRPYIGPHANAMFPRPRIRSNSDAEPHSSAGTGTNGPQSSTSKPFEAGGLMHEPEPSVAPRQSEFVDGAEPHDSVHAKANGSKNNAKRSDGKQDE